MGLRSSPAARALRQARQAASLARRTGCDISEAPGVLAERGAGSARDSRVVAIGSGIAGLGCAFLLWAQHGIRSEVYEYNAGRPGGRIRTLRGFFDGGQYTEEHGEFISSEHTRMRRLAAGFGLTLEDVNV